MLPTESTSLLAGLMLLGKAVWTLAGLEDPIAQRPVNSWSVMIAISLLGYLTVRLSDRAGIPPLWEQSVPRKKGLFLSALIGLAFGAVQILMVDMQGMQVPMVGWPLSVPVYFSAGILSELLFHFIPLVLILWLLSSVILKNRGETAVFWTVAVLVSLWEPVLQTVMMLRMGILPNLLAGIFPFVLVFFANFVPVIFIKTHGLLVAVVWRLSNYLLWHIIYGALIG